MRVLMVNALPSRPELGAARPQIELTRALEDQGHAVDHFDQVAAFGPDWRRTLAYRFDQRRFARAARRFLRAHVGDYDVIDAVEGCLPYTKASLAFDGLLVSRSVGLHAMYRDYVRFERRTWPELMSGTPLSRAIVRYENRAYVAACARQLERSDLVNVLTDDERDCVRRIGVRTPVVVQPNGVDAALADRLASAASAPARRLARQEIVFVGSWTLRKGRADFARIVRRTRELRPDSRFRFLGTWVERDRVLADLGLPESADFVDVLPGYSPDDLPSLLADATVGVLPSYTEGFGLVVVELLAAGLPTVAYDASGPRSILDGLSYEPLVPVGDAEALAERLATLLAAQPDAFAGWSAEAAHRARDFLWDDIARATAAAYEDALRLVRISS
jgi:glycosyltransferase involved in cell wall biosynthesis